MAPGPFHNEQKNSLKEVGNDNWAKEGRGGCQAQSEIKVIVNRREEDRAPPRPGRERDARNNIPSLLSLQLDDVAGESEGSKRGRSRSIQRGKSPTGRGRSFSNNRGRGRGREHQVGDRRDPEGHLERERPKRQHPYHRSPTMARARGRGFAQRGGMSMGPPPTPDRPSFRERDGSREGSRVERGNNSQAENMDGEIASGSMRNRRNGQGGENEVVHASTPSGFTSRTPGQEERERKDTTLTEMNHSEERGQANSSESQRIRDRSRSDKPGPRRFKPPTYDESCQRPLSRPLARHARSLSSPESNRHKKKNQDQAEQYGSRSRSPNSAVSDREERKRKANSSETDPATDRVQESTQLGPGPSTLPDSSSGPVEAQVVPEVGDTKGTPATDPAVPTAGAQEPANSEFVPDHQTISEFYGILDNRQKAFLRRRLLQVDPTARTNGNGDPSTSTGMSGSASMPISLEGLHDEIVVCVIAANPILSAKFFPTLGKIQEESLRSLKDEKEYERSNSPPTFTNEFEQSPDWNPNQSFIQNLSLSPARPGTSSSSFNTGFTQVRGNGPYESAIYPSRSSPPPYPPPPQYGYQSAPNPPPRSAATSTNTHNQGPNEPNTFTKPGESYPRSQIGFSFQSAIPSPPNSPTDSEIEVMLNEDEEEEEYFDEDYWYRDEDYGVDSGEDSSNEKDEQSKNIPGSIRTIGFGKKYVEAQAKKRTKVRGRTSPYEKIKPSSSDNGKEWMKNAPYPEEAIMPPPKYKFPQATTAPRPRVIVNNPIVPNVGPSETWDKVKEPVDYAQKTNHYYKRDPAKSPERRSAKRKIDFEDSDFPAKKPKPMPTPMKVPPACLLYTPDTKGSEKSKKSSSSSTTGKLNKSTDSNQDKHDWYIPNIQYNWDYNQQDPNTILDSGVRNKLMRRKAIEQGREHKSAKPGMNIRKLIQNEKERYATRRAAEALASLSTDTDDEIVPPHIIRGLEKAQFCPIPNFAEVGNLLRTPAASSSGGARTPPPPYRPLPAKDFGLLQTSSFLTPEQIQQKHAGLVKMLGLDWTVNAIKDDETDLRKKEDAIMSRAPDPRGYSVIHESIQLCRDREKRFLDRRRVYEECVDLLGTHLAVKKMINEEFHYIVNKKQLPDPGDTVLLENVLTKVKENPGPFKMNLGPLWY